MLKLLRMVINWFRSLWSVPRKKVSFRPEPPAVTHYRVWDSPKVISGPYKLRTSNRGVPRTQVGDGCWRLLFPTIQSDPDFEGVHSVTKELLVALSRNYPMSDKAHFRMTFHGSYAHVTVGGHLSALEVVNAVTDMLGADVDYDKTTPISLADDRAHVWELTRAKALNLIWVEAVSQAPCKSRIDVATMTHLSHYYCWLQVLFNPSDPNPYQHIDDMMDYGPIMRWGTLKLLWQMRSLEDVSVKIYKFPQGCHIEVDPTGRPMSDLVEGYQNFMVTMPDVAFPHPLSRLGCYYEDLLPDVEHGLWLDIKTGMAVELTGYPRQDEWIM